MCSPPHNDKIRGIIAVLVIGVFCGIPVVSVVVHLFGFLNAEDLGTILQQCVLYLGPLTGVVLGYYFHRG